MMNKLHYDLNNSSPNSSSTITLEEEIQEDYQPSQEEVLEYAAHLGMDLEKDQGYFDIARAGLKAPLPPEWKPCQKNHNGQQDFYYKNIQTGQMIYEHPCDIIYRKKYMDAKALDSKKPTKKSGINKFRAAIEQQRDDDVIQDQGEYLHGKKTNLNDMHEDKSILIESQYQQRQKIANDAEYQAATQILKNTSSALQPSSQLMFEQMNQDYNLKIRDYEKKKQQELQTYKDNLALQVGPIEEDYKNQLDPGLARTKQEFQNLKKEKETQLEDAKKRTKRKMQENMDDEYFNQEQVLKKQSEQELNQFEEVQEKRLRSQLNDVQSELRYKNLDLKKKIDLRKKKVEETDRKLLREVEAKQKRVQDKFEKEKNNFDNDLNDKLQQFDSNLSSKLKNEKENFLKQIKEENAEITQDLKNSIQELKDDVESSMRSIKDSVNEQKFEKNDYLQRRYKLAVEEYDTRERAKMESDINSYRINNFDNVKRNKEEEYQLELQHFIRTELDINSYQKSLNKKIEKLKEDLQQQKKQNLQNLKDKYSKSHKYLDNKQIERDIELYMQMDHMKTEIEKTQEETRQLQKQYYEKQEKIASLQQVTSRYELFKDTNQIGKQIIIYIAYNQELVKYDLEHKQFIIQKLREKLNTKQEDIEKLSREVDEFDRKQLLIQQSQVEKIQNKQVEQVMQTVNQLKEMILNPNISQAFNESKIQQSILMKESQYPKQLKKQDSSVAPPSIDYARELRLWQTKIVEERVQLNKHKEECRNKKSNLKRMQEHLFREQEQLREEISQSKISLEQNNMKKNILKRMKADIQSKMMLLSKSILILNEQKMTLSQKDTALQSLERCLDKLMSDPNIKQQNLDQIQGLWEMYQSLGDIQMDSSPQLQGKKKLNHKSQNSDLKFQQDLHTLMDQQFQLSEISDEQPINESEQFQLTEKPIEQKPVTPFIDGGVQTYNNRRDNQSKQNFEDTKQQTRGLRTQLINHQDWMQNFKYKLSKNFVQSPDARKRLQDYSQQLLNGNY